MPSKLKMGAKHHNSVHVKSGADLVNLHDFLKKNKKGIFLVVVMMEGCPHCVTLEKDVWNPLLNEPSRKVGMAAIQHDQLENTPLKSLSNKIRGYPTVIKVENGQSKEIENPRDLAAMKETVGVSPEEVLSEPTVIEGAESLPLSHSAEEIREDNSLTKENIDSLLKSKRKSTNVNVPNVNDDILDSQKDESMDIQFDTPKPGKGTAIGGSLYESLLSAGKDLAPAAILTTAAIASRFAIGRRKSKRSKRSNRKTRSKKH